MTDRPIIFSAPMIRALLGGTKTQTRSAIKKRPALDALATFGPSFLAKPGCADLIGCEPYDRLWVREAWGMNCDGYDVPALIPKQRPARDKLRDDQLVYFATETDSEILAEMPRRPSIHMPRWASRLTLAVTDVRVQRLQDISEADALAEGSPLVSGSYLHSTWFRELWESLHGDGSWAANPWVVALTFTVAQRNIDAAAP